MRWPRVHYNIEPSLLAEVRQASGEERRAPGVVLSRWAELGRRAEAAELTKQIEAAYAAKESKNG